MAQWINLNQNNRSVIACANILYCEKKLALSYRQWVLQQAGRQASRQNMGGFRYFYNCLQVRLLFCLLSLQMLLQHQNCISVGFCQVKLISSCVFKCEKFGYHFSCQSLLMYLMIISPNSISGLTLNEPPLMVWFASCYTKTQWCFLMTQLARCKSDFARCTCMIKVWYKNEFRLHHRHVQMKI